MNIHFHSKDWRERILSNFADTPFTIVVEGQECRCGSVEGFWQGLKCEGTMRQHVFLLSGLAAKRAGAGKHAESFTIAGREYLVGSNEHADLIKEAIRQKILQNPEAAQALKDSKGLLTHRVPGHAKAIFRMELFMKQLYRELFEDAR